MCCDRSHIMIIISWKHHGVVTMYVPSPYTNIMFVQHGHFTYWILICVCIFTVVFYGESPVELPAQYVKCLTISRAFVLVGTSMVLNHTLKLVRTFLRRGSCPTLVIVDHEPSLVWQRITAHMGDHAGLAKTRVQLIRCDLRSVELCVFFVECNMSVDTVVY